MRHGKKIHRLGRPADQRKALLRALTTQILTHGAIKTTKQKAKAVRPWVDKMIMLAKDGSDAKRQQVRVLFHARSVSTATLRRRASAVPRNRDAASAPRECGLSPWRPACRRRAPAALRARVARPNPECWAHSFDGRTRHQVASWLYDKSVVDSIFEEVPTRYADRRNDFTKMFPTLSRRGDNAQMVRARACVRGVARVACVHASCASRGSAPLPLRVVCAC